MLRATPIKPRPVASRRCLRVESLEDRCMLSHPAVAAVNMASTSWASGFVSYLESCGYGVGGYAIPTGSATQLQTLSWTNIDQIRITFSEDVVVDAADLSISGVNQTAYVFSDFAYDSNTYTAVWTLDAPIAEDKLFIDLDADGMDPVCSTATAEVLDGAWTDCQSTFNSGDSQGGTDFEFRFNALPGDVNANNSVNPLDAYGVMSKLNKSIGQAGYDIRYDVDGNGSISYSDYTAVQGYLWDALPAGDPVGMSSDAPTTCGFDHLGIAKGTVDHVLTLTDFFEDAEDLPGDLVYSIINNSNPSLFSSVQINSGALTLTFAENQTGEANLTIRAMDTDGLVVDTEVEMAVSEAPIINDFMCSWDTGKSEYKITGNVTDIGVTVFTGYVVTFSGLFDVLDPVMVAEDGTFIKYSPLTNIPEGLAKAQTTDLHGVPSQYAYTWFVP